MRFGSVNHVIYLDGSQCLTAAEKKISCPLAERHVEPDWSPNFVGETSAAPLGGDVFLKNCPEH